MKKNMKSLLFSLLGLFAFSCTGVGQVPDNLPEVQNPMFDKTIRKYLSFTIPVVSVDELRESPNHYILLDARKYEEYQVSHLPGAIWVGHHEFSEDRIDDLDKDQPVLLYCSIGYRSEKIGERLEAAGFSQVYNLYGSIFEWTNRGYPLEGEDGQPVKKVHGYDAKWSKWVDAEDVEKVW
jgi:rhodanese-related sulfurtransferase